MSGIDDLKNRLLRDGEADAKEIEAHAAAKAREVLDGAREKARLMLDEARSRAEREGIQRKERIIAGARLDARNSLIAAKQDTIDMVFKSAAERIDGMNNEEYSSFMEKLLLNNIDTGSEEVILSQKDANRINPGFIDRVNDKLSALGKEGKLHLSIEGEASSGLVIRRGGIEVNCTIASMIRVLRDDLEAELADILFGER